jgi:hypothetical protein
MTTYRVIYEFRSDDGMSYSMATHSGATSIETAAGEIEARQLAIEHAYRTHSPCSHVRIQSVRAVTE